MKNLLSLFLFIPLFISCKKDDHAREQAARDAEIIQAYIGEHNLDARPAGDGLYYVIEEEGSGSARPHSNSYVTVAYKGYFTDGTVFDQSPPEGIGFSLSNVIKGWQKGIPLFKKNGKGKLLIPSALGYGERGSGSIPPDAVLIFDIELKGFY